MLGLQTVSDPRTKPRLIEAFDKDKKTAQTNFSEVSFAYFSFQRSVRRLLFNENINSAQITFLKFLLLTFLFKEK